MNTQEGTDVRRAQASRLRAALVELGHQLPVSLSYELLAATYGLKDWNVLSARPSQRLLPARTCDEALADRLTRAQLKVTPTERAWLQRELIGGHPMALDPTNPDSERVNALVWLLQHQPRNAAVIFAQLFGAEDGLETLDTPSRHRFGMVIRKGRKSRTSKAAPTPSEQGLTKPDPDFPADLLSPSALLRSLLLRRMDASHSVSDYLALARQTRNTLQKQIERAAMTPSHPLNSPQDGLKTLLETAGTLGPDAAATEDARALLPSVQEMISQQNTFLQALLSRPAG